MDCKTDLFLFSYYDKYSDELVSVMKNVETQEKIFKKIEKPKIPVYKTIENQEIFREFVKMSEVKTHMCSYKWREWDIARLLNVNNFNEMVKEGTMNPANIHLNRNLYGSDLDIRDYMIMRYMDEFPHKVNEKGYHVYDDVPPIKNLHIGYLDIETDIKFTYNREDQPVYMVTYIDAFHNVCYTYYLYNKEFEGIDELETNNKEVINRMVTNLQNDIDAVSMRDKLKEGIIKKKMTERLSNMKFYTKKFTDEAELHRDMWQMIIRKYKPDYLQIFNAEYDIGQTELRADKLGIPRTDLFTIPEMGTYINHDYRDRTFNPAERRHDYNSACMTKIIDSMILYYCRRKTEGFSSYNLSDTAERELGIRKLGYGHICSDISELPYTDFVTTYHYNVRDVLLMVFLEDVLRDTEYLLATRYLNRTEYDRVFIPLIAVTNSFYHISYRNNKILPPVCKNRILAGLPDDVLNNLKDADPIVYRLAMAIKNRIPIEGGLCSDPTRFKGEGKKDLYSFLDSDVLEDLIDEDAKSMYPNALISSLIAMSTLYGVLTGLNDESISQDDAYRLTTAIINKDIIEICSRLFNLPNLNEILTMFGYEIDKPKPKKFTQHSLEYLKNRCNEYKFDELHNILKNIFKPTQTEKDVEVDDIIRLRTLTLLSNNQKTSMSYFGTMFSYSIYEHDSIISPIKYIELNKDYDNSGNEYIVIDTSKKENQHKAIDNSLLEFVLPKKEPIKTVDLLVKDFDISDKLWMFNSENPRNIRLDIDGFKVDTTCKLMFFNKTIFETDYNISIKSKTKTNKKVTISSHCPISLDIDDDILSFNVTSHVNVSKDNFDIKGRKIYSKENNVFDDSFIICITTNNGKTHVLNFEVIKVTVDIHSLDIEEKDEVLQCTFKYTKNLNDITKIKFEQMMYFVNY